MGTSMEIQSIDFDLEFRQHGHRVTYTQIGNSIYDSDLIEKFEAVSRRYWHLEGECGFTGELSGRDVIALLKDYNGKEPKNVSLILENITQENADDYYRITISE